MKLVRLAALATAIFVLSACSAWWVDPAGTELRKGTSSSLVDYLYPGGEEPPPYDERVPMLQLPLRVGLAFVPGDERGQATISEAKRAELLEIVKAEFIDREYISHIEVIPETYLRSTRGFEGLAQVARLYSVDVMALVSYDQVAAVDDKKSSFLYWTIVGAYVIEGTENEVQTFVDTAVFDVTTRRLLFRAPGTDRSVEGSTMVELTDVLRATRTESFEKAVVKMSANLVTELDRFETRLEEDPTIARVEWQDGKGGAGRGGGGAILWLLPAVLLPGLARRHGVRP